MDGRIFGYFKLAICVKEDVIGPVYVMFYLANDELPKIAQKKCVSYAQIKCVSY